MPFVPARPRSRQAVAAMADPQFFDPRRSRAQPIRVWRQRVITQTSTEARPTPDVAGKATVALEPHMTYAAITTSTESIGIAASIAAMSKPRLLVGDELR